MATRGRRVHSIEKSIQLLDCFWQMRRPLALSELERMTGWAKSTIHGLLASMLDSAVVEQNATDGKYRLGYHLFELGSAVSQGWDVPEICTPHLQRIVDQIQESAYLARLSGDELILVACEEPHAGFRVASEAGTRLPLHCTSQGKIILANRPANEEILIRPPRKNYLIVDGYNIIFAWEELAETAKTDLSAARRHLIDTLSSFAAFRKWEVVLVFDGYKVKGNPGEKTEQNHIKVVYTRENETGDAYIEALVTKIGGNYSVRVATSDGLVQLSALRSGVTRMSARELREEVELAKQEMKQYYKGR